MDLLAGDVVASRKSTANVSLVLKIVFGSTYHAMLLAVETSTRSQSHPLRSQLAVQHNGRRIVCNLWKGTKENK